MRHAAADTSCVLYSFSAMTHSPFSDVAQREGVKGSIWRSRNSVRESPVKGSALADRGRDNESLWINSLRSF